MFSIWWLHNRIMTSLAWLSTDRATENDKVMGLLRVGQLNMGTAQWVGRMPCSSSELVLMADLSIEYSDFIALNTCQDGAFCAFVNHWGVCFYCGTSSSEFAVVCQPKVLSSYQLLYNSRFLVFVYRQNFPQLFFEFCGRPTSAKRVHCSFSLRIPEIFSSIKINCSFINRLQSQREE